ncbi:MAG: hypothetical protein WC829_16875 [Hyphomicrobium sp.]|jgi:hypothetical protein
MGIGDWFKSAADSVKNFWDNKIASPVKSAANSVGTAVRWTWGKATAAAEKVYNKVAPVAERLANDGLRMIEAPINLAEGVAKGVENVASSSFLMPLLLLGGAAVVLIAIK